MADDPLGNFEAMLGAFANIVPDREEPVLTGVRCPKCGAEDFARVEAVYDSAVSRITHGRGDASTKHEGGLTDEQIVDRLAPPMRRSPIPSTLGVAVLLGAAAFFVNRRFGSDIGFFAILAAAVGTVVTLLTRARALSDGYYNKRGRWRKLFICRQCGQRVDGP